MNVKRLNPKQNNQKYEKIVSAVELKRLKR